MTTGIKTSSTNPLTVTHLCKCAANNYVAVRRIVFL